MTDAASAITEAQLLKRIRDKLGKEFVWSELRDGSINLRKAES